MRRRRRFLLSAGVFATLFASYAFFWHARDWNSASRLMLTYALVDRGTVSINGLQDQTRDRARVQGRYYTDKLPGFSLLAVPPYAVARHVIGLPPHPLNRPGFTHWPADFWATLGTSGLATALAGAVLVWVAGELGCGPQRAVLIGLAYGLATPAYVYATMSYGHQLTALFLLSSFVLLWKAPGAKHPGRLLAISGALAAGAAVVELQVGPVSAVLGGYALTLVVRKWLRPSSLVLFGLGALGPTAILLGYNLLAFGSPLDMGYFHEDIRQFSQIHSRANPLGLQKPNWSLATPLLIGGYRGLFFYAPITMLAIPGWIAMARRDLGLTIVTLLACLAVFLVNLSYPNWDGGWSTGPRLLVPLLPFAMIAVAGLLAAGSRGVASAAVMFALAGGLLMLLFQGVGGRVPQFVPDPLRQVVLPAWAGEPLPTWATSGRFVRNLVSATFPRWVGSLPASRGWMQFLPLVVFQVVTIAVLLAIAGRDRSVPEDRSAIQAAEMP